MILDAAEELKRVNAALAALGDEAREDSEVNGAQVGETPGDSKPVSVRELILSIMEEEPRSWTASELVGEITRRNLVTHVKNRPNAVRTGMWQLRKDGLVRSVPKGNVAMKWMPELPDEEHAFEASEQEVEEPA